MDGAEGADAFAETELPPGIRPNILIDPAQALEVGRVGHEDPRHDARLRCVTDRRFADGERLKHLRMRVLIGLGHNADLADDAVGVDLAGRAVGAGPLVHWPARDSLLVGIGYFIILAVIVPGI